jgi:hypothetical protein
MKVVLAICQSYSGTVLARYGKLRVSRTGWAPGGDILTKMKAGRA